MPDTIRTVQPLAGHSRIVECGGRQLQVPAHWQLLEPGDAALTRRVKTAGPHWIMKAKRGKRVISIGVWAAQATIEAVKGELELERRQPGYNQHLQQQRQRRAADQRQYVQEFYQQVLQFLDFAPQFQTLAEQLAHCVSEQATPVGAGTVARTQRLSIEQRAEAAVMAWLRHQTTAYDRLSIARIKGERRRVRRQLAASSRELLKSYRQGRQPDADCPLQQSLVAANGTAATQDATPRPERIDRSKPFFLG